MQGYECKVWLVDYNCVNLKTDESATQKLIQNIGHDVKPIVKQRNTFIERMYWIPFHFPRFSAINSDKILRYDFYMK